MSKSKGKVERLPGVVCIAPYNWLFLDQDPKMLFVIFTPGVVAKLLPQVF